MDKWSGLQQAGASQQNFANAPVASCNPSAFGSIEDAARQIDDATSRVLHFVNRLCGTVPEQGIPASVPHPVPNGLLHEAEACAESIRENVARIYMAMERLEQRLP